MGIPKVAVAATVLVASVWLYAKVFDSSADAITPASRQPGDAVGLVLRAKKPTIIEFGANSCASCREMKPILHALAQDPRIAVADVDVLKEREYISRYQIRLMPTQVFYNAQGQEIGRHMGKISAEEILTQLGIESSSATSAIVQKVQL